jgi:nitrile hydratase accessory protein
VALHENGLFSWTQWAKHLSARLHQPDAVADGSDYYQHWLLALEDIVVAKHAASPEEVRELTAAWQRAAHATPHGSPIRLENDPEAQTR